MSDEKSLLEEILEIKKENKYSKDEKILDKNDITPNYKITKIDFSKDKNIEKKEKRTIEKTKTDNEKSYKFINFEKKEKKKSEMTNQNIKRSNNEKIVKLEKREIKKEEKVIPVTKENKKIDKKVKIKKIIKKIKSRKMSFTPYIRTETDVRAIMHDVIRALFPAIIAAGLVYGIKALLLIATSVLSAVITEKIFSKFFLDEQNSTHDLSAVITGILLALTLAPLTPLPIVIFGASMAIIFGKLMYGGIGKNIFNPAVVGREFMTVFFPAIMTSGTIWYSKEALRVTNIKIFTKFFNVPFTNYLDGMILTPSGSLGSYSIFALVLGGLYLLLKNRISWHIPVCLFVTSFLATIFLKDGISVSTGGLLLTGIFMATDMPTSPSFSSGKIYYGIMLGIVIALLSILGIKNETLSYVLIILNPFTLLINDIFRPVVFGFEVKNEVVKQIGKAVLLTIGIIIAAIIFSIFHKIGIIPYLIYLYIAVLTVKMIK